MKIPIKFNQMKCSEYKHYIDNHKKYTNFNTLGLYRSIIENKKISIDEKIEIREYAHKYFLKSFNFLQLKDPSIFIKVSTLGQKLTVADERQLWDDVRKNQEKILEDKRIKHRNFGDYSKHNCGIENCNYNGMMVRQASYFSEDTMHFNSDKKNKNTKHIKSVQNLKQRKNKKIEIEGILEDE